MNTATTTTVTLNEGFFARRNWRDWLFAALVVAGGPASEIVSTQWPGRVSRVDRSGGGKTKGIVVDLDDRGDPWAHERFQKRFGVYKEKGWKIVSQVYS